MEQLVNPPSKESNLSRWQGQLAELLTNKRAVGPQLEFLKDKEGG